MARAPGECSQAETGRAAREVRRDLRTPADTGGDSSPARGGRAAGRHPCRRPAALWLDEKRRRLPVLGAEAWDASDAYGAVSRGMALAPRKRTRVEGPRCGGPG